MKHQITTKAGLMIALAIASVASADLAIDFVYDPGTGTTIASYSGTMGVDHTTDGVSTIDLWEISENTFQSQTSGNASYVFMNTIPSTPWGPASIPANSRSGDMFRFGPSLLVGPANYTATTAISGSLTFLNKNLTDLGFDSAEIANGGTIILDTSAGNVNVDWSASAIPEPATLGLAALFGGGIFAVRRIFMI